MKIMLSLQLYNVGHKIHINVFLGDEPRELSSFEMKRVGKHLLNQCFFHIWDWSDLARSCDTYVYVVRCTFRYGGAHKYLNVPATIEGATEVWACYLVLSEVWGSNPRLWTYAYAWIISFLAFCFSKQTAQHCSALLSTAQHCSVSSLPKTHLCRLARIFVEHSVL